MNNCYKIIPLILLLISLMYCKQQPAQKGIEGSWYSCSENGDYVEMHIKGNQYKFSSDFGKPTQWNAFTLKGDTLIQYNNYMFEDSIVINKAIIERLDAKELKLNYLTSGEVWAFHYMTQNGLETENGMVLRQETIERATQHRCKDQRSPGSIKQDSINHTEGFQF